jgi:hypothetical protein
MVAYLEIRRWLSGDEKEGTLRLDITDKDQLHLIAPGFDAFLRKSELLHALAYLERDQDRAD